MDEAVSASPGAGVSAEPGRSGIWIRAIDLTRNQNSVPAEPITARPISSATEALGPDHQQGEDHDRQPQQRLHAQHRPVAHVEAAPGRHEHQPAVEQHADERGPLAADLVARAGSSTRLARPEHQRQRARHRHRQRALALAPAASARRGRPRPSRARGRSPAPSSRSPRPRAGGSGARALALLAPLAATALRQLASARARRAARRPPRAGRRRRGSRAPPRSASAPASTTSSTLDASMPPIANHGTVGRARPRGARTRARPRAGPAWSGVSHTGPDAELVGARRASAGRRAASGEWVERPTSRLARAAPRPTGMSSWPTCTPSAPAASARSGRSLTQNSAPCSSHSRAEARGRGAAARRRRALGSRSWSMSAPPVERRAQHARRRGGVGHEVEAARAPARSVAGTDPAEPGTIGRTGAGHRLRGRHDAADRGT